MALEELLDTSRIGWINSTGSEGDVVISSRVRLARNLKDVPFPHLLNGSQAEEVIYRVYEAFTSNAVLAKDARLYLMEDLSETEKNLLVEMHFISPDLARDNKGAVIISGDRRLSIMINEEDHLRIQCVFPGLDPQEAYELASRVDDVLEEQLDFAFDERLGYLTACPTNVGTGIRVSVMMHLPMLTMLRQVDRMFSTVAQLGLVVRGLYGEGTEAWGNLYQISNQITLGKSEEDIIQNVLSVAGQIIASERQARRNLKGEDRLRLEDRILRSYGILTNSRLMTTQEAMALISDVRLGVDLGIIKNLKPEELNNLFITAGPSYIQQVYKKDMTPLERDLNRANFLRGKLLK
ncbi:protein arginine kinase [Thermosediminibacter oceani]|uniref:Protein-arginine kinase n=1 Tax=Thermosediminibacter oceani (strain ATCC BAA-1034 / DSM 16646 / JW/IW-1228P) TaxID=555079 RepID=D9S0I0_THEOJ|nr:protein arginine kinase [Thermosediminibacter oceani]ADL08838.1 ATP:guanido phosphotransferase [Thermosediminibacter oceani DSM 16646]